MHHRCTLAVLHSLLYSLHSYSLLALLWCCFVLLIFFFGPCVYHAVRKYRNVFQKIGTKNVLYVLFPCCHQFPFWKLMAATVSDGCNNRAWQRQSLSAASGSCITTQTFIVALRCVLVLMTGWWRSRSPSQHGVLWNDFAPRVVSQTSRDSLKMELLADVSLLPGEDRITGTVWTPLLGSVWCLSTSGQSCISEANNCCPVKCLKNTATL